jgi:hypothetical protein
MSSSVFLRVPPRSSALKLLTFGATRTSTRRGAEEHGGREDAVLRVLAVPSAASALKLLKWPLEWLLAV